MNNILRVELWDTNTEQDILMNKVLIDEGFAVHCEEHYQSKVKLCSMLKGECIYYSCRSVAVVWEKHGLLTCIH